MYEIVVPAGEISTGINHPFVEHEDILCLLTVEQSELRHLILYQRGRTLLNYSFSSATEADDVMITCLGFDQKRSERTVKNYKKIVDLYCRWSQAERDAGLFRPLLKDLLMRPGTVQEDPDLQAFGDFYSETSNMAQRGRPKNEMYSTFAVLRQSPSNRQKNLHSDDQVLLDLYRNLVVRTDFRSHSYVYNNLRAMARWLYENETRITLVDLCADGDVMVKHAELLDSLKRAQGLCSSEPIARWLQKLRFFKSSLDLTT
jgi:hypothetical protein